MLEKKKLFSKLIFIIHLRNQVILITRTITTHF